MHSSWSLTRSAGLLQKQVTMKVSSAQSLLALHTSLIEVSMAFQAPSPVHSVGTRYI